VGDFENINKTIISAYSIKEKQVVKQKSFQQFCSKTNRNMIQVQVNITKKSICHYMNYEL